MSTAQFTPDAAQTRARNRRAGIDPGALAGDPLVQFERWRAEWRAIRPVEPDAAVLATASTSDGPSARCVYVARVDHGFVFFTDLSSRKAREIALEPRAALCFSWLELARQVRVCGRAERLSDAENSAAFASQPRPQQLLAWASDQTRVVADRAALETELQRVTARFASAVPACPRWGGFRLVPESVEFWQARSDNLHDRFRYTRAPGAVTFYIEQVTP